MWLELGRQAGCPGRKSIPGRWTLSGRGEGSFSEKVAFILRLERWSELVKWNWEVRMEDKGDIDVEKEDMIEQNQQNKQKYDSHFLSWN